MQRNHMTRRRFLQGVSLTTITLAGAQLMAACAAPAPTSPNAATDSATASATDSSAAPAATDVVLRVQNPPEIGLAVMPTIMAERFQADTGIQVVIEETIYGEIETKTQTGFISNTLQDILYGHHRWLFINFVKGIYMEIDDLLATNPPEDYNDIYPSVMAGNSFDGKNFSFPSVVHPGSNICVSYNKTMLEEKGLPLPQEGWTTTDWAELATAAAEPENGIFGLSMESMSAMHYYGTVARCFGSPDSTDSWIMNPEGTQIRYSTPIHQEVTAWYTTLLNNRVAPRSADLVDGGSAALFIAGLSATQAGEVNSTVSMPPQIAGAFEVDGVLLPVGPEGRQGTGNEGNQHMMNSNTPHPEEAWELLKLYSSGEAGVLMVLEGKLQPNGHRSAWTHPDVIAYSRMIGVAATLLDAGLEPFPMPHNTRFTEANNTFQNEINLIWEGEVTYDEHASVIDEKVNAILALPRPE